RRTRSRSAGWPARRGPSSPSPPPRRGAPASRSRCPARADALRRPAMSPARILVVDDEQAVREVLAELLSHWGYEVDQTADGKEALKIAADRRPDVIVSDLVMPKLDGLSLVRA